MGLRGVLVLGWAGTFGSISNVLYLRLYLIANRLRGG